MVRVLLADDQPLIRAGLRMFLEAQPNIEVVGEAADGAEAVELAMIYRPDVVLMDVRMPGMDGVAATRQLVEDTIREDDHLVKVIILTTYHVDDAVYAALRAGASGFLLKDAEPGDLVRAVHAVAAGEAWLDPAVARRLLTDFAARPELSSHHRRYQAAHRARARGTHPDGTRPLQRRHRQSPHRRNDHRKDPCRTDPPETGRPRPGPSGRGRLPGGPGTARRSTPATEPIIHGPTHPQDATTCRYRDLRRFQTHCSLNKRGHLVRCLSSPGPSPPHQVPGGRTAEFASRTDVSLQFMEKADLSQPANLR